MVVSSVSDFVHFVALAAPALSQITVLRNRDVISGAVGPAQTPGTSHIGECVRQAYVFVSVRGYCGGWFAAEVFFAYVHPPVPPRYLRPIDLGGLLPWRRRHTMLAS